jgi:uncharacterized protein YbcI
VIVEVPGPALGTVTTALVRLYKDKLGKGPQKASARWVTDDVLAFVLEDTLTPSELTLRSCGADVTVADFRRVLRNAIKRDLEAVVAEALERHVRDSAGTFDVTTGTASELFWLS